MDNAVDRHVFYISDGTAITAEVLGHAVMSQFPVSINSITLPFVENESRARAVKDQIDAICQQTGERPLVFYSIVIPEIRNIILQSEGFCQDIVQALVAPLQEELKLDPTPVAHRIADDMDNLVLPAALKPLQHKLFGLTINPERLAAIREERRENSRYASMRQCRLEVAEVEALYRKNNIPCLNSTNYSVEEIATKILDIMGLNRRMY